MSQEASQILGIDYGTKKVGVAVSDRSRIIATPVTVLANDDQLMKNLASLAEEYVVDTIVIGESQNYHGQDNPVMAPARKFAEALGQRLGVSVVFEPEVLTTAQALRTDENRGRLDASAAALILQSYLDRRFVGAE